MTALMTATSSNWSQRAERLLTADEKLGVQGVPCLQPEKVHNFPIIGCWDSLTERQQAHVAGYGMQIACPEAMLLYMFGCTCVNQQCELR